MHLVSPRYDKLFWFLCILCMSLYILYEHATNCLAIDLATMIDRHRKFMAGESEFYNPWQYRVLAPLILEGFVRAFRIVLPLVPEIAPYLLLRFLQNIFLLYVASFYYRSLGISNPILLFAGMMILCFSISNSVFQSDLSFNTYFDIIFYLLAAWTILQRRPYLIIPITFLAALNRETSALIPAMLVAAHAENGLRNVPKKIWSIAGASVILFLAVFVFVRWFYEYPEAAGIHGITSPLEYLSFNVSFLRMYPQLFGTLGLVPLIAIIGYKRLSPVLKKWFWLIVPIWFIVHFVKSTAVESRLFLVPMALIFVPSMLFIAQFYYRPDGSLAKNE